MTRLDGAERYILQAISKLQGNTSDYIPDSQIAQEAEVDIAEVRNWLQMLDSKGLIDLAMVETGLKVSVKPNGVLALKQSLPQRFGPKAMDSPPDTQIKPPSAPALAAAVNDKRPNLPPLPRVDD